MLNDIKVALFLALRTIKRGKVTFIVTTIIMAFSVINMLFAPSLFDGIDYKIDLQTIETSKGHVVIEPKDNDNLLLTDVNILKKKIRAFPEVGGVSAQYIAGGNFKYKDESENYGIKFINPDDEKTVTKIHGCMVEGDFLSKTDADEIIIGVEISGTHDPQSESYSLKGVKVGDKINIKFTNGIEKEYRVKGIFKTGWEGTDYSAFLTNKELENVFGMKNEASQIIIKLNQENIEKEFIRKLMITGIGEDIYNSRSRQSFDIGATFVMVKAIVGLVAFIVAMTTLFVVIYINAVNKKKLIAIIKAVGINRKIILLSFVFQSLFYTLSGIVVGLLIMYLVIIPYFISNPLELPFGAVSLLMGPQLVVTYMTVFLAFAVIAGAVPAYQVIRENIIDAMR